MVESIAWFIAGAAGAFVAGTFVEYAIHYLMHKRIMLGKIHIQHHGEGTGQGWWGEFLVYFLPALPFMIGCFLIAWLLLDLLWFGIGIAVGGAWYAAFAAYAHQVQHERPELAFWMRRPVHTIHHVHNMWKHNYGISLDWWDHIFGTYMKVEWENRQPIRFRNFFRIHWRTEASFAPDSIPPAAEKALAKSPEQPQVTQPAQS